MGNECEASALKHGVSINFLGLVHGDASFSFYFNMSSARGADRSAAVSVCKSLLKLDGNVALLIFQLLQMLPQIFQFPTS